MSETDIGIPAMDHAVRMGVELHYLPNGPLDMYTRLELKSRPYMERKGITPQDLRPEYSILYFPENNQSFNEFYETISVVRHNPEEADETKIMLQKAMSARLGQWAINEHEEERPMYKQLAKGPGSKDTSEQLDIPYAAIIFSTIPKISRHTRIAQLHLFHRTKAERALLNLQKAIKDVPEEKIHTYEAKADSVARVIC